MHWIAGFLVAVIIAFSIFSGLREISLYRQAKRGELLFLVSRKRLRRRLIISFLLLLVASFLLFGFFVFSSENLLIWLAPLILILAVICLGVQDFRETSKDLDRILHDATDLAGKKVRETKK